jgi:adenylate kinase family enzyme
LFAGWTTCRSVAHVGDRLLLPHSGHCSAPARWWKPGVSIDRRSGQPDTLPMLRIVIIGNAGGGKSTLARKLAVARGLQHVEIDRLLWQKGWKLTPTDIYTRQHDDIIARDTWLIDGLGQQTSIPSRIARATEVILIDMPLWMHFWLAAERQIAWAAGKLEHAPGGIAQMPPMQALFQSIWDVEQNWMPGVRGLCDEAEAQGKTVIRLANVDDLDSFARTI